MLVIGFLKVDVLKKILVFILSKSFKQNLLLMLSTVTNLQIKIRSFPSDSIMGT
jgi:hypothetical protein